MAIILDVGQYITELLPDVDKMKLYKLCYFSQGWHLAWTGKPLFSDEFEGWRHGPVSKQRRHHTEVVAKGHTAAAGPGGESARLSAYEAAVVARIVEFYGNQKSTDLSELSHGAAWQETRVTLNREEPGNKVMSIQAIHDEFANHIQSGKPFPTMPTQGSNDPAPSLADFRKSAAKISEEWNSVFELLATR